MVQHSKGEDEEANKVANWREIRASNTHPPVLVWLTEEDKAELVMIANEEICLDAEEERSCSSS